MTLEEMATGSSPPRSACGTKRSTRAAAGWAMAKRGRAAAPATPRRARRRIAEPLPLRPPDAPEDRKAAHPVLQVPPDRRLGTIGSDRNVGQFAHRQHLHL